MRELFRRLLARPGIAAELVAASLFANILALASPLFVIQVLNRYIAHGVDSTLVTLTIGVIIAIVLEFGFRQVRMKLARGLSAAADERASVAGFAILTGAKTGALERVPADIRREAVDGAAAIQAAYSAPNITTVLDVPFALLFIGVLFLLSPLLAGIAACFAAAVFVAATVSLASLRLPTRDLTNASGAGNALVGTANQAMDTVRAFAAAGFLRDAWAAHSRLSQGLRRRITGRQGLVQSLTQSATPLMSVAIIAVAATLVVKGQLDVGAMIGANILAARALIPISRFAQLGEVFAKARQSMRLMSEFAKIPMEPTTGSARTDYQGGLELKDMAFAYPDSNAPLFESFSLELKPGAVIGVTGGNGTGKTTLARLLLGLLEPTRGRILADGLDLRQVAPEWWRRQVIYLPQEPAFLNATIGENLGVANPGLDDKGLNRLIDAAGLRGFLDESAKGFDTPLTNNGANLSLGIRRRLALARGLATDGMLVVFDEPTEGLDAEGRAAVYAIMNGLAKRGRTIVAISHDPNIVKGAGAVVDLNVKPVPRITLVPQEVPADTGGAEKEDAAR